MTACGHCIEASLTNDVNLVVGTEQTACVREVLSSNVLIRGNRERDVDVDETPFKLLFTGRTVAITLLSDNSSVAGSDVFEPYLNQSDLSLSSNFGEATPLLQASLFNPLCSLQSGNGSSCCELSCFDIAVSYTEEPSSVSKW